MYIRNMKLKQFIMKLSRTYEVKKYREEFKENYEKHMQESYKKYEAWLERTKSVCKIISK